MIDVDFYVYVYVDLDVSTQDPPQRLVGLEDGSANRRQRLSPIVAGNGRFSRGDHLVEGPAQKGGLGCTRRGRDDGAVITAYPGD